MRIDEKWFYEGICKKCKNLIECKGSRMVSCARTRTFQPEQFEIITGIKKSGELKKADFTIISVPTYVKGECPYCEEDFEVDYNDFGNSGYPGDWKGETIECPYCEKEIIIDDVEWD